MKKFVVSPLVGLGIAASLGGSLSVRGQEDVLIVGDDGICAPPAPRQRAEPVKVEPTAYDLERIRRAETKRARKADLRNTRG